MNWMGGAKYRESFHAKNRTRMKKFMQQRKQQQKRFFDQIQQENANISSITGNMKRIVSQKDVEEELRKEDSNNMSKVNQE